MATAAAALCIATTATMAQERAPPPPNARVYDMSAFCPDERTWRRYMPDRALIENTGGAAVLDCALNAERQVTACVIVEETPERIGFGRAALNLACMYTRVDAGLPETSRRIYQAEDGSTRARLPFEFNVEGASSENPRSSVSRRVP